MAFVEHFAMHRRWHQHGRRWRHRRRQKFFLITRFTVVNVQSVALTRLPQNFNTILAVF